MKKTVIIILAVLPVFLLVTIAIAGRILSIYQEIPVERVEFVDRLGSAYSADDYLTFDYEDRTCETKVKIYPELAQNKGVTYKSSDESICSVDESGVLTAVRYGTVTITVTTDSGKKNAILNVIITADVPVGVTLSQSELSLNVGAGTSLSHTVDAQVAVNKSVVYESSNPSVATVDASGRVTAKGVGTAIITVRTVIGSCSASCTVTVSEGDPPLRFDFSSHDGVTPIGAGYEATVNVIDLLSCVKISDKFSIDDVTLKLVSGSDYGRIDENGVLTITGSSGKILTIEAQVGEYTATAKIRLVSD